jgi:hypothetical protein
MLFIPSEIVRAAKIQLAGPPNFTHVSDSDTKEVCNTILSPHPVSAHSALFIACVSDQIACKIATGKPAMYITTILSVAY